MYTHRFPGPITHSSLSKHLIPLSNEDGDQGFEGESIRLAIVYKVVQNEQVAYHSRVYHFGIYDTRTELQGKRHIFVSSNRINRRTRVIL